MHAGVFEDPTAPRLRYPKVFATWRYHADPYRLSTIGVSETSVFLLIQDGVFVRRMNQNNSCMFLMRSLFRYISRVPWYISSTVCCWYRSIFWTLQQSSTQLDTTRLRETQTGPVPAASKTPRPNPTESWRPKGWPRGTVSPKALDSKNPNTKSCHVLVSYWFRIKTLRIQGYFKVTSVTYYCIL
jgi:hypothetical protein